MANDPTPDQQGMANDPTPDQQGMAQLEIAYGRKDWELCRDMARELERIFEALIVADEQASLEARDLLDHPFWPKVQPFLHIEQYDRDGGHEDPRIRIEFKEVPPDVREQALALEMRCVACGELMHPLRQRKVGLPGSLYYAPSCPLEVRVACSRGQAAADVYRRFKDAPVPPDRQLTMFERIQRRGWRGRR
jgi:hypothetical protein